MRECPGYRQKLNPPDCSDGLNVLPMVWPAEGSALAVMLDPCGSQTGKAMFVDGGLPVQEFIDTERITLAGFFKAEEAPAHGGNDFGLAADHPPSRIGWRKIRYRKRTTIRADYVLYARTHLYGHFTLYSNLTI